MIRFEPFSRSRDLVNSQRRLAATGPCVSTLLGRLQPGRRTCFYRDQHWKSQGAYFNTCPGALSALSPISTRLPPPSQFITTTNAAAAPSGPFCLGPVPKASQAYSSHGRPLQINPRDGNQLISEQNAPAAHNALNLPLIKHRDSSKQLRVCSLMSECRMHCTDASSCKLRSSNWPWTTKGNQISPSDRKGAFSILFIRSVCFLPSDKASIPPSRLFSSGLIDPRGPAVPSRKRLSILRNFSDLTNLGRCAKCLLLKGYTKL